MNAHAGMPFCGVSQFAIPAFQLVFGRMAKGNSPFGAWVVCIYRVRAMQSLTLVNATTRAFFVSSEKCQKSLLRGVNSKKAKIFKGSVNMKNTRSIILWLLGACVGIFIFFIKEQVETNANNTSLIRKAQETETNTNKTSPKRKTQEIPIEEKLCDELVSCAESNPKCEAELKKRLKLTIDYVDSAYAEGDIYTVGNVEKKLEPFFTKLKCDSTPGHPIPKSLYESVRKNTLSSEVVDKRIRKLLPNEGCIEDSLQYEKFTSTITQIESLLQEKKSLSSDQERYLNYLNRNCPFNYKYSEGGNLLVKEEKIIKAALEYKVITKTKGEKLYNNKFSQIEKDNDLGLALLRVVNAGTSFAGVGEIKKKKNRTVSYIEYPSVDLDAEAALQLAVVNMFKAHVYSVFSLHPSVDNVEIGFAVSELEYNLYVGFYHGIYAVTVKSNRSNLEKYFNKNNLKSPNFGDSSHLVSISNDDRAFFDDLPSYSVLKKWCKTNGFTCTKYLLERVR